MRQPENPPFKAKVLATDSLRDIALLQFEAVELYPEAAPLPTGQITSNNVAEPLLALGYSGAFIKDGGTVGAAGANVGVLSQIVNFGPRSFGLNLVTDVAIDPGDSGGPVLDQNGLVVGMARAATERTGGGQRVVGTFYAVHVDEILLALPALKNGESR